ncbi:hypothetical protein [Deinococcus hohokamensis]|uniref:Uncharacterized protein n=1 Tax=Deinococcus hohokamensis TaxID=309883 RepID=A0ABV9ID17_9DEIO
MPPEVLNARPAAQPADRRYRLIVGLIGGNRVVGKGLLSSMTPCGGGRRQAWLRLTEGELTEVRRLAQAHAQATGQNFYDLAIRGLDRLIGAALPGEAQAHPATMNVEAYRPAPRPPEADRSNDQGKYLVGAQYREPTGRTVTITGTRHVKGRYAEGLTYLLDSGRQVTALHLNAFEFLGAAPVVPGVGPAPLQARGDMEAPDHGLASGAGDATP